MFAPDIIEFIELEKDGEEEEKVVSKVRTLTAEKHYMDTSYVTDLEFENFKKLLEQIDILLSEMLPLFKEREERWRYSKCKTSMAFQYNYIKASRLKAEVSATLTGYPVLTQVSMFSKNLVPVKGYTGTYSDFARFRIDSKMFCADAPTVWRRRFKTKPKDGIEDPEDYNEKTERALKLYNTMYNSVHRIVRKIIK